MLIPYLLYPYSYWCYKMSKRKVKSWQLAGNWTHHSPLELPVHNNSEDWWFVCLVVCDWEHWQLKPGDLSLIPSNFYISFTYFVSSNMSVRTWLCVHWLLSTMIGTLGHFKWNQAKCTSTETTANSAIRICNVLHFLSFLMKVLYVHLFTWICCCKLLVLSLCVHPGEIGLSLYIQ